MYKIIKLNFKCIFVFILFPFLWGRLTLGAWNKALWIYHYLHNNNLSGCKNCSCKCFYFLFIETHVSLTCIGSEMVLTGECWSCPRACFKTRAGFVSLCNFWCLLQVSIHYIKKLGSVKLPVDTLYLHGENTSQGIYLISVAR